MTSLFDEVVQRRDTGSAKWSRYGADVLPMWVADMDFAAPPAVIEALAERLRRPVFGYAVAPIALREQIVADMAGTYGWTVAPEDIVFIPGVEPGFNMAAHALLEPGQTIAIQMPIYRPIRMVPSHWRLRAVEMSVTRPVAEQATIVREAHAVLLCNPHNPTGKVYDRDDLLALAAVTGDRPIISDEIHCDLLFDGRKHIPVASLAPEIARRTITLMSAAKTYNIPGLKTAFAIVTDPALRARFEASRLGLVDSVNVMGLDATLAAFRGAREWKDALVAYLQGNRDLLAAELGRRFPGIVSSPAEATYLAWLDCSALGLDDPHRFLLEKGKLGLSAGAEFGPAYSQYVRLNFGCPRATLLDGIDRIGRALDGL